MTDAVKPWVAELPNLETTSYINMYFLSGRKLGDERRAHFCTVARILGRRRLLWQLMSELVAVLLWAVPVFYTFDQANQVVPDTRRAFFYHGGANGIKDREARVLRGYGASRSAVPPKGAAGPKVSFCVGDGLHFVFNVGTLGEKGG